VGLEGKVNKLSRSVMGNYNEKQKISIQRWTEKKGARGDRKKKQATKKPCANIIVY
jgi:hypothetical protein